ncbi:MAG: tRNA (guanosine(46)-N7)-methyltransferase TrmB [Bdellovibrionales bacterium]|nr:tRNA (guanosine(46)-N7)-methyltransferase TrmB [Bdellovibrionales bacterium]
MMYGEFAPWSFDESALDNRGQWRSAVFQCPEHVPLDLEIGTGNGTHFAHLTETHPERCLVGLELKYKTLVQSIRRSLRAGCKNGRMAKIGAEQISELFAPEEINNVYIHFPDPWPKKRQQKNRLIQEKFLKDLYMAMKPGGEVEFKTDHYGYFLWAVSKFRSSPFIIEFFTEDLHRSFRKDKNFVTHFESLFLHKRQPIFCCILKKAIP